MKMAFVFLLTLALAGTAQARGIELADVQQTPRLSLSAAAGVLQSEPQTVTSPQRKMLGWSMAAGGGVLAVYMLSSACAETSFAAAFTNTRTCGQAVTLFGAGLGVSVVGVLFATIWSDVAVSPSRDGFALSW